MIHFGHDPWGEFRADLRAAKNTLALATAFHGGVPNPDDLLHWKQHEPIEELSGDIIESRAEAYFRFLDKKRAAES